MGKNLPLEECSIQDIYMDTGDAKTFVIPIYQRNYAWEYDHIKALINDVYDSYRKSDSDPYYIGTLVTFHRRESVYEVIDGQQRLTTIYLALKAMGITKTASRLTYDARKISDDTLQSLTDLQNYDGVSDTGIKNGYKYMIEAISDVLGLPKPKGVFVPLEKCEALDKFRDYFLDHVRIIHYRVPKDVDLNHYFEIMNSRGEQLEKHEILKAEFCDKLKHEKHALKVFTEIWDACSDMGAYIQKRYEKTKVFGDNLDDFIVEDPDIIFSDGDECDDAPVTIEELLDAQIEKEHENKKEQVDSFQPIIDFPNLLLIVLKVTLLKLKCDVGPKEVTLDDKELLTVFAKVDSCIEDRAAFAKTFACNLLKAKYLLDNYIVHHDVNTDESKGNPWQLKYYSKSSDGPVVLSSNSSVQDEMVHLLSMFEVTFTSRQRKNYLFYCMAYLFYHFNGYDKSRTESSGDYLTFLHALADKYFYDVYLSADRLNAMKQPSPNAFDDVLLADHEVNWELASRKTVLPEDFEQVYPDGSYVSLYVFNYTDYRLWKRYADELRGEEKTQKDHVRIDFFKRLGCSDFGLKFFDEFYFSSTRKSLEHYYPQSKAISGSVDTAEALCENTINCFGNFAMIGSDANSTGSNWDPVGKIKLYQDSKLCASVASIKFKIMLQICQDNSDLGSQRPGMKWDAYDIKRHQKEMLEIILKPNK